ncbi:MAG TPA: cytosine permease [Acidimicrobiales bacterium]|nr:cytosine permease [Acidimicrobiales bacterium]
MSDVIEQYTISHIPENRRYGEASSLLPFWFTANTSAFTIVLGAVGVELGLSLAWSIVAIVVGSVVGGVFMAYHSAQGPKLGLPQLIQSRAQFGFYGSLIPNFLIWIIFFGYIVGENVLASQALGPLIHVTFAEALALSSFVTWLVVVFGYRIMHDLNRVVAVLSLVLFAVLLVRLGQHLPHVHYTAAPFKFSVFLLATSIFASGQVGWAPYVSDYSRYLPVDTSVARSFWYTYAGSVVSAILFAGLGAVAGVVALNSINSDSVGYLAGLVPAAQWLIILVLLSSIVAGNAINLYSPLVSGLALVSKSGGRAPGALVRAIGTALIMAITSIVAIGVSSNFLVDLSDFAAFLLYIVVPWSAINLVDYYFVRHGNYSTADILSVDGRYGRFNVKAVALFLVGIGAEVPFMNASWPKFEGPVASSLGGADISWIVGFVVTGTLYYLASRRLESTVSAPRLPPEAALQEAPASSY